MRRVGSAVPTDFSPALAAVTLVLLGTLPARADVGPPALREPGTYLSVGGSAALSIGADDTGAALGAEASVVAFNHIGETLWLGGYADVLWDSRTRGGRFSIGPEIGFALFGLDAGYVGSFGDAGYHHGFAVRGLLTFAFVALYGRVGHLFGDAGETWGEVGLLFKYPIALAGPAVDL